MTRTDSQDSVDHLRNTRSSGISYSDQNAADRRSRSTYPCRHSSSAISVLRLTARSDRRYCHSRASVALNRLLRVSSTDKSHLPAAWSDLRSRRYSPSHHQVPSHADLRSTWSSNRSSPLCITAPLHASMP